MYVYGYRQYQPHALSINNYINKQLLSQTFCLPLQCYSSDVYPDETIANLKYCYSDTTMRDCHTLIKVI